MERDILYRYPGDQRDWPTGYLVEDSGLIAGFGNGGDVAVSTATFTFPEIDGSVIKTLAIYKITKAGPVSAGMYANLVGNALFRLVGTASNPTVEAQIRENLTARGIYVGAAKKSSLPLLIGVVAVLYFISK